MIKRIFKKISRNADASTAILLCIGMFAYVVFTFFTKGEFRMVSEIGFASFILWVYVLIMRLILRFM